MPANASQALLCWYAVDKRPLPWRPLPGAMPDPYRIWLSEVMLQQTTVAHASPYFDHFTTAWPDVEALAAAEDGEVMRAWAGLGYYARARNLLACAREVKEEHGGRFPEEEAALRRLPGIGPYIAAAIAAIAFGKRAVAVDANVERIMSRLFAVEESLPRARGILRRLAEEFVPEGPAGDITQAMMDLGQTICLPRRPDCPRCPILSFCAAARTGRPEAYPVKPARKAKPARTGVAYWLEHGGEVLLTRRPDSGLLGGMMAFPTQADRLPEGLTWRDAGSVDHIFTHFSLTMKLLCAETVDRQAEGLWWPIEKLAEAGLPTLFAKLAARGAEWRMTT